MKRQRVKKLKTNRLILRTFSEEDADAFFNYCKNPVVGNNAGWKPHSDKSESYAIILSFISKGDVWAVTERDSGRLIGSIGFSGDEKRLGVRMLGYALAEDSWGKGYMTEAALALLSYCFKKLKADVVTASAFTDNERSQSVLIKCGFKFVEKIEQGYTLYDGTKKDVYRYELRSQDFKA